MEEKPAMESQKEAQVNMGKWLSEAWNLVNQDFGFYILTALIYIGVIAILSSTVIGEFIVIGPLTVGYFYILIRKIRKQETQIGDLSKGFSYFAAAVISNILIILFSAIGFSLCIIPGIVVSALYMFTPIFIFEKNMDFWQAMEASRKLATKHIFELSVFALLLSLITIVGVLACLVGLLITIPLCFAAIAFAYNDLAESV